MKFLFLVLFLGVAQAKIFNTDHVYNEKLVDGIRRLDGDFLLSRDIKLPVDKDLIKIQLDIIKLLKNINHLNTDKIVLDISKQYNLEDNVDRFMDKKYVMDLVRWYKTEGFLDRNRVFNVLDDVHRYEAVIITKVLLNAKTLGDFFNVACWLRNRVNGGVFVYAMSVAVKNRDDLVGVILPPMYEIVPFKFFKNKVVQKAVQLKMQEAIFDEKYAKTLGIEQVDKNVYIIKTDYTGVNIHNNGENRLSYFTEDIGLNNNFYLAEVTSPFWMDYSNYKTSRHNDFRRGEFSIFMYQQILARYYMERLSNGLGEIDTLKFDVPVKTGYNPSLRHHNGLEYSVRPNNYVVNTADNFFEIKTFEDYERRVRDAIDRGYIWTADGTIVSLNKPEDIDKLGNMIDCNAASVNDRFYHGLRYALKFLGNRRVIDDNSGETPSVLEGYTTMLRDPITYQLFKRILFNVYKFDNKLRPYKFDDLIYKGVRINDVKVDKLVTYFDTYDVDITNIVNRNIDEMRKNTEDVIIKARQVRLNHLPFNVEVDVTSEVSGDVVVKTFLGPKLDGNNRKINLDENRMNFLLLDRHITTLKKGVNSIVRNSRQFNLVTDDMIPTRKLITKIDKCLKGEEECFTRDIKNTVIIPDRLLLPRGSHGGMVFQLFVTITPINVNVDKYDTRFVDTLRYPLDRRIVRVNEFLSCDNFFFRDVVIYNKEGVFDKYNGEIKNFLGEYFESYETDKYGKQYGVNQKYNMDFYKKDNVYGDKYTQEFYKKDNVYGDRYPQDFYKSYTPKDYVVGDKRNFLGLDFYKKDNVYGDRYPQEFYKSYTPKDFLGFDFYKKDNVYGDRYPQEFYKKDNVYGDRYPQEFYKSYTPKDYVVGDKRNFLGLDFYKKDNVYGDRYPQEFYKSYGKKYDVVEDDVSEIKESIEDRRYNFDDSRDYMLKKMIKNKMVPSQKFFDDSKNNDEYQRMIKSKYYKQY